jgi:hypothetical protein
MEQKCNEEKREEYRRKRKGSVALLPGPLQIIKSGKSRAVRENDCNNEMIADIMVVIQLCFTSRLRFILCHIANGVIDN